VAEKRHSDIIDATLRFLGGLVLQGLAAAIWLLLIPKEAGNAEFLGYSFRRLLLVGQFWA
jgi:hypothetical protein